MADLLTIPVTISVGDVSIYLASNDNSVGNLFGKRLAAPTSPITIAIVTDALTWAYASNPTEENLRLVANYLTWLCGKYGQQAQYVISGAGGGTVSPVTPSNPSPIQFITSSTSYITTGSSSKTISSFINYNLLFTRGGIPQSTVDTEPTYYTWDKVTAAWTCSPALQEGELIQLYAIS